MPRDMKVELLFVYGQAVGQPCSTKDLAANATQRQMNPSTLACPRASDLPGLLAVEDHVKPRVLDDEHGLRLSLQPASSPRRNLFPSNLRVAAAGSP